ncbi:hypothetical protein TD95_000493 [Thielaviopsis punctulata]|uniref:Uncharacterized protein n=1 Tax=Thielaviopsis punctulata TaxID=72032 RepID=A0A0F4ZBZ8_9PEZI|nr:hypothetical protein TD95_000493 [Thielaviopsis punctulata]
MTFRLPYCPQEDEKLRATALKVRRGGNCPNSLEVLQQLTPLQIPDSNNHSPKLHLVSPLPHPDSPAVQAIARSFSTEATLVDLSTCLYRPESREAASCYIMRSAQTGSRTIVTYNELREMDVDEFNEVAEKARRLGGKQWWHFEGRIPPTTLHCIELLRNNAPQDSLVISVEVEKPGRDGLEAVAASADVVFISRNWAERNAHIVSYSGSQSAKAHGSVL